MRHAGSAHSSVGGGLRRVSGLSWMERNRGLLCATRLTACLCRDSPDLLLLRACVGRKRKNEQQNEEAGTR